MATERKDLEDQVSAIGRALGDVIPEGTGFCLMLFDFGAAGNMAYTSNAERSCMLEAMKEFIAKAEGEGIHSVYEN